MDAGNTTLPIGQQVSLPGHFDLPVVLESARPLGQGYECRVRLPNGTLEEAVIPLDEAAALAGTAPGTDTKTPIANAEHLRLLIESARIRLACAHDPHFAVSLSGIRTLPHQIEAVYIKKSATRGDEPEKTKRYQLGDTYWLYVVWDPLGKPDPAPLIVQNPAKHLDHAKKEIVAARYFDIPAAAIEQAARKG